MNRFAVYISSMNTGSYVQSIGSVASQASSGGFLYLLLLNPGMTFYVMIHSLTSTNPAVNHIIRMFGYRNEKCCHRALGAFQYGSSASDGSDLFLAGNPKAAYWKDGMSAGESRKKKTNKKINRETERNIYAEHRMSFIIIKRLSCYGERGGENPCQYLPVLYQKSKRR